VREHLHSCERVTVRDPCDGATATSIAFRQNMTIQFGSNLLPVEREEAGTPHPCVSVSIRGQIACFSLAFGQLSRLVLGHGWTRIHTDRMFVTDGCRNGVASQVAQRGQMAAWLPVKARMTRLVVMLK
jgi:hypothetical protein